MVDFFFFLWFGRFPVQKKKKKHSIFILSVSGRLSKGALKGGGWVVDG